MSGIRHIIENYKECKKKELCCKDIFLGYKCKKKVKVKKIKSKSISNVKSGKLRKRV